MISFNEKHFLPKSLNDAPQENNLFLSIMNKYHKLGLKKIFYYLF